MYVIELTPAADRQFRKLSRAAQAQLAPIIDDLENNPRPANSIKLSGCDFYRIRSGDYRIIYEIRDRRLTVTVVKVAHRREAYDDTGDLKKQLQKTTKRVRRPKASPPEPSAGAS